MTSNAPSQEEGNASMPSAPIKDKIDSKSISMPPPPSKTNRSTALHSNLRSQPRAGDPTLGSKYQIPSWSGVPPFEYKLEVLKGGTIIENVDIYEKPFYVFGRSPDCDIQMLHPTISRYHAVIQHREDGAIYVMDLGSTHGSKMNKHKLRPNQFAQVPLGSVLKLGDSTRLYVLGGPPEAYEAEHKRAQERILQGAKASGSSSRDPQIESSGCLWGQSMDESVEENEEKEKLSSVPWEIQRQRLLDGEVDVNEKQEKLVDKLRTLERKRHALQEEINRIVAKEHIQGELTEGQQRKVSENSQRIDKMATEIEDLDDELQDSVLERETSATAGNKRNRSLDDDDDDDDDDFYDRTLNQSDRRRRTGNDARPAQKVHTVDSLREDYKRLEEEIKQQRQKIREADTAPSVSSATEGPAGGEVDSLEAFMKQTAEEETTKSRAALTSRLEELEREAAKTKKLLEFVTPAARELAPEKPETPTQEKSLRTPAQAPSVGSVDEKKKPARKVVRAKATLPTALVLAAEEKNKEKKTSEETKEASEPAPGRGPESAQPAAHPETAVKDSGRDEAEMQDRKRARSQEPSPPTEQPKVSQPVSSKIDVEKPGLQLRKKPTQAAGTNSARGGPARAAPAVKSITSIGSMGLAEDSVSEIPLAKKPRGSVPPQGQRKAWATSDADDMEATWVPPQGQTGDGKTSLNDRFGY